MLIQSGWITKLGFEIESPTHSLLGFIKAMGGKADTALTLEVIAGKFDDKSKGARSAKVLLQKRDITATKGGKWTITAEGNNALITATSRVGLPKPSNPQHRRKRKR